MRIFVDKRFKCQFEKMEQREKVDTVAEWNRSSISCNLVATVIYFLSLKPANYLFLELQTRRSKELEIKLHIIMIGGSEDIIRNVRFPISIKPGVVRLIVWDADLRSIPATYISRPIRL